MSTTPNPRRFLGANVLLLVLVGAGSVRLSPAPGQSADDVKAETAAAPEASPLLQVTVDDFAWLEGTWRMSDDSEDREEQWSGPLGNGLVGTLRWLHDGEVRMYELMAISKEKGRFIFRLKHFSHKLAGWEEKNEALTYALAKIEPNRAVFDNRDLKRPGRLIYYRPVPQTLIVRVEDFENGEKTEQEFQFSLVKR